MFSRRSKTGYFVIEGLNSFATVYYFYYFYFFMQKQFGFGNKANLALAAVNGGTYAVFCFFAGKFAQRFGYFRALKLGFGMMCCALTAGLMLNSAAAEMVVMALTVVGMCFTWPTLEALVSEGETRSGVQHMVGVYNVVWAATAAVANFTGGALLANLGFKSLFYVPMVIQLTQLGLTLWLEAQVGQQPKAMPFRVPATQPGGEPGERIIPQDPHHSRSVSPAASVDLASTTTLAPAEPHPHPPLVAKTFLRMAWLANPFAYIGINTLIAVMPGLALRLGLSTAQAGFCCSIWCFSRFGAFFGLWLWSGWHYRFPWLVAAYLSLAGSFITILLAPNITVLVTAQLLFGSAVGLIYFSSLFYSMDLSETKGEHGGFHEAAIGLGNFAGPALGAAALEFFPPYPNSGALAVTLLLLGGLAGLTAIWRLGRTS